MQCPLKFRLSVVDGMPQPPSEAAVKGTVVHLVLEALFELDKQQRTIESALELLPAAWSTTLERERDAAELFADAQKLEDAERDTNSLVSNYFQLEHPQNLDPKGTEQLIDARLSSGLLLRGIIDRVDESVEGNLRVIDYKTGRAPGPKYVADALYQMRFYALLLRQKMKLPTRLQLLYLRSTQTLTLDPKPADIDRFEDDVNELWRKIERSALSGDFKPRKTRLCDWCAFQAYCPVFGGVTPPLPESGLLKLLSTSEASSPVQ